MSPLAPVITHALEGHSLLALPLSMAGGLVAALNPCCVSIYPAATTACCAVRTDRKWSTTRQAVVFVLGMALATSALGITAALAGRAFSGVGPWFGYAIAVVPLVMGAHVLGVIRVPLPRSSSAEVSRTGVWGAFLGGLLLTLVIAPCGTPVLAAVLSYAVYTRSAVYSALLLFLYGVGAAIPVIAVGSFASGVLARLDRSRWRPWVDRGVGLSLLGMGYFLLWTA